MTAVAPPAQRSRHGQRGGGGGLADPAGADADDQTLCEQRVEGERAHAASLGEAALETAAHGGERRGVDAAGGRSPAAAAARRRRRGAGARGGAPLRGARAISSPAAASSGSSPRLRSAVMAAASAALKRRGQTRFSTGRARHRPSPSIAARTSSVSLTAISSGIATKSTPVWSRSASSAASRPTVDDSGPRGTSAASCRGVRSRRSAWPLAGPVDDHEVVRGAATEPPRRGPLRADARGRRTRSRPGAAAVTAWKVPLANSRRDRNGRRSRRRK